MFLKILYQITILFILMGFGFVALYRKWISQNGLEELVSINILLFLPCLIFHSIMTNLTQKELLIAWYMPLLGMFNILLPLGIGTLMAMLLRIQLPQRKTFIYLLGFNNYRFLAIPLVASFFGEKGIAFLFVQTLGCGILYWSLGIQLLSNTKQNAFRLMLNPPLVTLLLSILLVLFNLNTKIPHIFIDISYIMGGASIPVFLIAIGGYLAELDIKKFKSFNQILCILLCRLFLIPILVFLILYPLPLPAMVREITLIVACMPCASTAPVLIQRYGNGDKAFAATCVFVVTIASIISIPLMLTLLR